VIAAYNAERCVGRAVASAREAGARHVVVVDDGSTDGTAPTAGAAGAIVVRQTNSGPGAARNRGIEIGAEHGDHVLFLDADDELLAGSIAAIERAIALCPGAAAVVGGHVQVGGGRETVREPDPGWIEHGKLYQPWPVLGTNHVFCATGLTLTDAAVRAGLRFDAGLRFAEDRDLLYRASSVGDIAISGAVLVRKHDSPGQMTAGPTQAKRWLADQLKVARLHGGANAPAGAQQELERVCSWVLKNTCRVLCRARQTLPADDWDSAVDAFRELGWRIPAGAVKWRMLGTARHFLRV
jgi:glycosyltransferase involved in cell wall biosynthesis